MPCLSDADWQRLRPASAMLAKAALTRESLKSAIREAFAASGQPRRSPAGFSRLASKIR